MEGIKLIDAGFIEKHTNFKTLIDELEKGFSNKDMIVPMRHDGNHHDPPGIPELHRVVMNLKSQILKAHKL
jgi:hypothetical protein